MYGPVNLEFLKQRRDEMLREAGMAHSERALRKKRQRIATESLASAAAWEVERVVGIVRKSFLARKSNG